METPRKSGNRAGGPSGKYWTRRRAKGEENKPAGNCTRCRRPLRVAAWYAPTRAGQPSRRNAGRRAAAGSGPASGKGKPIRTSWDAWTVRAPGQSTDLLPQFCRCQPRQVAHVGRGDDYVRDAQGGGLRREDHVAVQGLVASGRLPLLTGLRPKRGGLTHGRRRDRQTRFTT